MKPVKSYPAKDKSTNIRVRVPDIIPACHANLI